MGARPSLGAVLINRRSAPNVQHAAIPPPRIFPEFMVQLNRHNMMNDIDIHYATESEAVGLAHLNIASFRHQIMWRNALPGTDPEVCIPMKHARCLEKLASPDVHVFSAVDTSTDHIVGYARWTIPWEENKVELSEEGSAMVANAASLKPQEIRDEIWTETFTRMKEKRAVHITKDDMVLDLLAILPEYQGKGIGSKLLRWGIQQADARNARIYLEATIEGYPLYHKYGWYEVDRLVIDYAQFGGTGQTVFVLMMRDPQNTTTN